MSGRNYAPLWEKLGSILSAALELERATIGAVQAELVAEFIDHNEFGLAHEQLTDALSDAEITPREETAKLLAEAATLMGDNAD
jgi:hypothetical protein